MILILWLYELFCFRKGQKLDCISNLCYVVGHKTQKPVPLHLFKYKNCNLMHKEVESRSVSTWDCRSELPNTWKGTRGPLEVESNLTMSGNYTVYICQNSPHCTHGHHKYGINYIPRLSRPCSKINVFWFPALLRPLKV